MRIYIAGPYSSDDYVECLDNVVKAMRIATALMIKGHKPFIPHLSHYWQTHASFDGYDFGYEQWVAWGMEWLNMCDALYLIAPSPGATRELECAYHMGKQVYFSLQEVPDVRDSIT